MSVASPCHEPQPCCGTYTVQAADSGYALSCVVLATNSAGQARATSANVAVPGAPSLPTNTSAPSLSGTVELGDTLYCSVGTWRGSPIPTYSFQWMRDGQDIASATASSYTIGDADCGQAISCQVTATNIAGQTSVTTATVTVPPSFPVDEGQLTALQPKVWMNFGSTVAIDGSTALVGAPDGSGQSGPGVVYVFTRTGTIWTEQAELTAPDEGLTDFFGNTLTLDGDTALVAAYHKSVNGAASAGVVYVFTGSGADWSEQAELPDPQPAQNDDFGQALALTGDSAVIGAPGEDRGSGEVYVYGRSGTAWTQQAAITPPDGISNGQFGGDLALSGDTMLIGVANLGYVYVWSQGTWTVQAQIKSPVPGADFAGSVALDGDTALIAGQSASYVFGRSGTTWSQDAEFDGYSGSVALSGDQALIGTVLFSGAGADWSKEADFTDPGTESLDGYDGCAALSGNTAAIGAENACDSAGAAYIFSTATTPVFCSFSPLAAGIGGRVTLCGGGLDDASAVCFNGIPASFAASNDTVVATVPTGATSGPITITTPDGTLTCAQDFTFIPPPVLTGFTPTSGLAGSGVTLSGSGFTGATSVSFNGSPASFTADSDTQITAIVPSSFPSGPITVTTPGGTTTSAAYFIEAPTLTGFTPTSGAPGDTVDLTGSGFHGATSVSFKGQSRPSSSAATL